MKSIEEIAKECGIPRRPIYSTFAKEMGAICEAYHKQKMEELEPVAFNITYQDATWQDKVIKLFGGKYDGYGNFELSLTTKEMFDIALNCANFLKTPISIGRADKYVAEKYNVEDGDLLYTLPSKG